jgi:hypothetical protein
MIAADPWQGGATWAVLQYVLGLRRLGHDVWFVEPISAASLRPVGSSLAESSNASYFRAVMTDFDLPQCSLLRAGDGAPRTAGVAYEQFLSVSRRADLLINVSGMLTDRQLTERIPVRAYLDLDPAFVQLWHTQGIDMRFAGHTHFVTVGQAIGTPGCSVPTCGLPWIPTAQPVVLQEWPMAGAPPRWDGLTTVANWRGYGSIEHHGVFYGQKAHSLRPLITLPTRTRERFMPALAIHPDEHKDIALMKQNRWNLLDPAQLTGTPMKYRRFVQGSKAEFGLAKSGYVASRCGWFSDRSACYLASGRPVIAQDTGFTSWLPSGQGLIAFQSEQQVLDAIEELNRDYGRHARAARGIAEEHFCSDRVLPRLLNELGVD